jgi:hypothetical protein
MAAVNPTALSSGSMARLVVGVVPVGSFTVRARSVEAVPVGPGAKTGR